jgi:nicotinamidase-related amidase
MLLDRAHSLLMVIDIQERLAPSMAEPERIIKNTAIVMKGAARLGVPILVTQQYPRGLGATVPELAGLAPAGATLDKVHFSCAADPAVLARIEGARRDQIVICGIETHICVLQTALQLVEKGYRVSVVTDAVGSRRNADSEIAFGRLAKSGVDLVTTEMVLFEWLGRAATPEFKELQALVK